MIKELDLERINSVSPYLVAPAGLNAFTFATAYGITLSVELIVEETLMIGVESYQFVIVNEDNAPSPNDSKVQETIIVILSEFFRVNTSALLYLCDSEGDKQGARARLFRTWFNNTELAKELHREEAEIVEEDGTVNYVTMLIRKDSPYMLAAVTEFREQAELFNKP